MRYLRYSIFLSALFVATGVFLPYVQVGVGGMAFGQASTMPLYNAVNNYSFIEKAYAKVEASPAERIADGLLARMGRSPTRLSAKVRKVRAALEEGREVRDQARLDTIGTVLRVVGIGFLCLLAVIAWLVLQSLSQRSPNRKRTVWTAVLIGIISVVSTALFFGVSEALVLANDELGASLLSLGSGAYMMLIAAGIGFASALTAIWVERRGSQEEKRSSLASA